MYLPVNHTALQCPLSKGKEKKKQSSKMEVLRLLKDAQYADQSGHPHRAVGLVNRAFSLLADLHPQISGERGMVLSPVHSHWSRNVEA